MLNARPASWLWFAAIVTVALLFNGRKLMQRLWTRFGAIVAGFLCVAGLLALNWQVRMMPHPPAGPLRFDHHPSIGQLIDQAIGGFGWYEVRLPAGAVQAWCVALAVGVIAAVTIMGNRERIVILLLVCSVPCVAILYDAYMRASGGYGVQGRYLWPLLIGLPILTGRARVEQLKGPSASVLRHLIRAVVIVIAVDQMLAIATNARRYDGGHRLWPLISPFAHASWSPHLGWFVAILLTIGAAGIWLTGLAHRSSDRMAGLPARPIR